MARMIGASAITRRPGSRNTHLSHMLAVHRRYPVPMAAALPFVALALACGDGETDPTVADPPRPTTVAVTPAAAQLTALSETVQLTAEVRDQNGQVMSGAAVTWASSSVQVASVNASGLATAAGTGTATITATSGSVAGSAALTVAQVVHAVTVSPAADTLQRGDTLQFTAQAADANGHPVADAQFAWVSTDDNVAMVDSTGLATGVGPGSAEITATSSEVIGRAGLLVREPIPATVAVTPDYLVLRSVGDTARLNADVRSARGVVLTGVRVVWTSSDNTVASVDTLGLVAAVGEGEATITAGVGSVLATAPATVTLRSSPATDREALIALYSAANGGSWARSDNWLTDAPLSEWHGVTTNADGRVTGLNLSENGLTGTLAPNVGNLSHLEELNLYRNRLTGPLPPQLGEASRLQRIDLGHNQFDGPIPASLGKLAHLRFVNFESMWLRGSIPPELGALTELRSLNLYRNTLSGTLPAELGALGNLEVLYVGDNRLTGSIPSAFTRLENIEQFNWSTNYGLCAPATASFGSWRDARIAEGPACDEADRATLEQLFRAMDGENWGRSDQWLSSELLDEWYGVGTDSIGRVKVLDLAGNGLAGGVPARLGELERMTALRVGDNALVGPMPLSLTRLPLEEYRYGGTQLCVPPVPAFRDWLGTITIREGTDEECPPLSERDILRVLHDATEGSLWSQRDNWLTDEPLESWYGVETDADGSVVRLGLRGNNLRGPIPPELGQLQSLRTLELHYNWLTGSIPKELAELPQLERLVLTSNLLTGPIPGELGNVSTLRFLELNDNQLDGTIPPELGNLSSLENLFLHVNRLEGRIPPELGRATALRLLGLRNNQLVGPIPAELGDLSAVVQIVLGGNDLSGPIPPQLGNAQSLRALDVRENELSGPIPPELGSLKALLWLGLNLNQLSGPIPPELGNLENLELLNLSLNRLTGQIPSEFSQLSNLRWLILSYNAGLTGPLPVTFSELANLVQLDLAGTSVCLPEDRGLFEWSVGLVRAPRCGGVEMATPAYLSQAVQSLLNPVPLVAGEEALLRVFVTAQTNTNVGIPAARATFFADGSEIHSIDVPGKSTPLPTEVTEAEASLESSSNAVIPGWVVRQGLEMVIEVDPEGTLDPELGVVKRIPESGRAAMYVRELPTLNLTVVPFLWDARPDSTVVRLTAEMANDPEGHRLLWDTHNLLPVGDLAFHAHEPVLTSSNDGHELLDQVGAIRTMESGTGHYMASISGEATGPWGVAWIPGWTSFVRLGVVTQEEEALTIAHEIGHNLSLRHAPCGTGSTLDRSYPQPDGSIGSWGLDSRSGRHVLVAGATADLMSYCVPAWVGEYHFSKAFGYRVRNEGTAGRYASAGKTILLWGGANAQGTPFLYPAFAVDAPSSPPPTAGEYEVAGSAADGTVLFSLSFDMTPVADSDGRGGFSFAVPFREEWGGILDEITLSGPGGSTKIDRNTDRPAVILRDPGSGQVRGIFLDAAAQAMADGARGAARAPAGGLEVLFTRGIPDASGWRR